MFGGYKTTRDSNGKPPGIFLEIEDFEAWKAPN